MHTVGDFVKRALKNEKKVNYESIKVMHTRCFSPNHSNQWQHAHRLFGCSAKCFRCSRTSCGRNRKLRCTYTCACVCCMLSRKCSYAHMLMNIMVSDRNYSGKSPLEVLREVPEPTTEPGTCEGTSTPRSCHAHIFREYAYSWYHAFEAYMSLLGVTPAF